MSDKCSQKLPLQYSEHFFLNKTFDRNAPMLNSSIFLFPCNETLLLIKMNFAARGWNVDNMSKGKWKTFTIIK
jgi:hypothetical protein